MLQFAEIYELKEKKKVFITPKCLMNQLAYFEHLSVWKEKEMERKLKRTEISLAKLKDAIEQISLLRNEILECQPKQEEELSNFESLIQQLQVT